MDTVCQPTKLRQHAAVTLARRCDVVIVIGGAASNNTRELAATCQQHCARVHHVQTAADCARNGSFRPTGWASPPPSTPDEVIDGVEHWLRVLAMRHERDPPRIGHRPQCCANRKRT